MDQELELKKMEQERELYVATFTPAEQKMLKDPVVGILADRSVMEAQQRAMGDVLFFYEVEDVKCEADKVFFLISKKPLTTMEQKEHATTMAAKFRSHNLHASNGPAGDFASSTGSVTVQEPTK
jgi:hypothetical protein